LFFIFIAGFELFLLILLSHYLKPEAEVSSVPLDGGADSLPGTPSLGELCLPY
jgi:hypothetical protein